MNNINSNSIPAVRKFISFFKSKTIISISKQVGFTKRQGKLLADTFVIAMTIGLWNKGNISLSNIAEKCGEIQHGLKITKQAIKERLKLGSELMKEVFKKAIEYSTKSTCCVETINTLKQFNAVYICDSTIVSLPDKLAEAWKGLGGRNAKAALKIQVTYNILARCYKNIEITKAPGNDSGYTKNIVEMVKENELVIFDLGYFSTMEFKNITEKGAYFISRVKTNTKYYIEHTSKEGKFQKISILTLLKSSRTGVVDTYVYIGGNNKKRMHCRLVAVMLPEKAANERVRKAREEAEKKNEVLTDLQRELLRWNILITNTTKEMLSAECICDTYRIRWQIELIFKSWKGNCGLDKLNNVCKEGLDCLLYGRLTVLVLMSTVFACMYAYIFNEQKKRISLLNFFNKIKDKCTDIVKSVIPTKSAIADLEAIIIGVAENSVYEKRKRKNSYDQLEQYMLGGC